MATSGTVVFRQNRDQISTSALTIVGAVDAENPAPNSSQLSTAATFLNLMVKAWQTKGLQLWERKYAVVFPQLNQNTYVLGSPGPAGDHATLSTPLGTGFVQTTLSVAATNGAGSVTLTSVSTIGTVGVPAITIASTWFIGIVLDSGTVFWTTVNGAPAGTVVTLSAVTTGTAAAGNTVYAYQTKLIRPLRIVDAFFRQPQSNDIPFRIISQEEYNRFGQKLSAGTPIQMFYDPQRDQGNLYVYTVPATGNTAGQIYIVFQKPIEDFNSASDDYDLPQEWGEALVWNLARRLMTVYSVPPQKANEIRAMAIESFNTVSDWDQENASVFLQPNTWMYEPMR